MNPVCLKEAALDGRGISPTLWSGGEFSPSKSPQDSSPPPGLMTYPTSETVTESTDLGVYAGGSNTGTLTSELGEPDKDMFS